MSQTKYPMPDDVKIIVINIVRGHARRVAQYQDKMEQAAHSSPQPFDTYTVRGEERYSYHGHGSGIGRPVEGAQARLEAVESSDETKRMRAVDEAKHGIGLDLPWEQREKLTEAIWDSCIYGKTFIYAHYHLPFGKTAFYERRREFLWGIATDLNLLEAE